MGKLHTLHRAIEREPANWYNVYGRAYGAHWSERYGEWRPNDTACLDPNAYRLFVRAVLRKLGYVVD